MSVHAKPIARITRNNGEALRLVHSADPQPSVAPPSIAAPTETASLPISPFEDITAMAGVAQTRIAYRAVTNLIKDHGVLTLLGAKIIPYMTVVNDDPAFPLQASTMSVGARMLAGTTQGTAHIEMALPLDEELKRMREITLALSLDLGCVVSKSTDYVRTNLDGGKWIPIAEPIWDKAAVSEVITAYDLLAQPFPTAAPLSSFVDLNTN